MAVDLNIDGSVSEGRLSSLIHQGGLIKGMFGESRTTVTPAAEIQPETNGVEVAQPEVAEVAAEGTPTETVESGQAEALASLGAEPEAEPAAVEETQNYPENIQKRIDQLTAQKHEARERAERAEADLTTLKKQLETQGAQPPVRVEDPQNPLAGIYNVEDLDSTQAQLEKLEEWCINNPQGGHMQLADGKTEFVDETKARSWQSDAAKLLRRGIPERRQFIANHAQVVQNISKEFPDFYKPGTELNTFVVNSVKALPQLTKYSDWPEILADAYVGRKTRAAQKVALDASLKAPAIKAQIKAAKSPAINAPASAAVGKVNGSQKAVSEGAQKYIERGGTKNLAALLRSGGIV
jgi:hypothetical protein